MLRIIAGRLRGRRLHAPAGLDVRPTADRVKESLFNVLQDVLPGARVLDLYAGTGNLGFEAWSRGARRVVLVESAPAALRCLRSNLALLGIEAAVEVVRGDALRYLAGSHAEPFDVVLADPPYAAGVETALLEAARSPGLRPGGCLVLQHARRWVAPSPVPGFQTGQARRFGDTVLDFFWREEETLGGTNGPDGPLSRDI